MKYTKFFNSNPSVSGNNAMSNIEALAKFDTWLAGQEIINISVGESQDTYTPLTFTKENGETYTVNIPTVKGETGQGFNFVGEWTSGDNEYHPYDVVTYNNGSYCCIKTVINSSITPDKDTANWSVFVPKSVSTTLYKFVVVDKGYTTAPILSNATGEYKCTLSYDPTAQDIYIGDNIITYAEYISNGVHAYGAIVTGVVTDIYKRAATAWDITIDKPNYYSIYSPPKIDRGTYRSVKDCTFNDTIQVIGSLCVHNIHIKRDFIDYEKGLIDIYITVVDDKISAYTNSEFFNAYANKPVQCFGFYGVSKNYRLPGYMVVGCIPNVLGDDVRLLTYGIECR